MFETRKRGPPLEKGVPAVVARQHQEQAGRVQSLAGSLKEGAQEEAPLWNQHGLALNTKQVCEVLETAPCVLVGVVNSTESDRRTGWQRFVRYFKTRAGLGLATVAISQVVSPDEAADATARLSEAFAMVVQEARLGNKTPICLKVCHQLCSTHRAPGDKLFLSATLKRLQPQNTAAELTPLWVFDASLFAAQAGSFEKKGKYIDPSDPNQGRASAEFDEFVRDQNFMARVAGAGREDPSKGKSDLVERLTTWVIDGNQLFVRAHRIPFALVRSSGVEQALEQAKQDSTDDDARVAAVLAEQEK